MQVSQKETRNHANCSNASKPVHWYRCYQNRKEEKEHTGIVEDTVDTLGALSLDLSTEAVNVILVGDIDLDGPNTGRLLGLVGLDGLVGQAGRVDCIATTLVEFLNDL